MFESSYNSVHYNKEWISIREIPHGMKKW
jgi:hypothetical protein